MGTLPFKVSLTHKLTAIPVDDSGRFPRHRELPAPRRARNHRNMHRPRLGPWRGICYPCGGDIPGRTGNMGRFQGTMYWTCCQVSKASFFPILVRSLIPPRFQAKNRYYRALTQLIREKSFLFVLVLRFSAVPGHITTALSASAGAHFFSYCMAAILVSLLYSPQVGSVR
jgi:hypothetical protein